MTFDRPYAGITEPPVADYSSQDAACNAATQSARMGNDLCESSSRQGDPRRSAGQRDRASGCPVLSVIMPAYNEQSTIGEILKRILKLPDTRLEVLVVDDGSSDQTGAIAQRFSASDDRVRVFRHDNNRGKGAGIRTALPHVRAASRGLNSGSLHVPTRTSGPC